MVLSVTARRLAGVACGTPVAIVTLLIADHAMLQRKGAFEDRSMPSREPKASRVLLVGGGVVAVASAFFLNARGFHVTLLEARNDVALGTSQVNAGTIRLSRSNPIVSLGNLKLALARTLLPFEWGQTYHFTASAFLDPLLWRWGFRFVVNSLNQELTNSTAETLWRVSPWASSTLKSVAAAAGVAGDEYSAETGSLSVQCSQQSFDTMCTRSADIARRGQKVTIMNKDEVMQAEPSLVNAAQHIVSGDFTPDDWSGDCRAFAQLLAQMCEKSGVEVRRRSPVRVLDCQQVDGVEKVVAVVLDSGSRIEGFDHVVVSAGCGSVELLRPLGIYLPIYPCKGYALDLRLQEVGVRLRWSSLFFEPLDMFVTQYSRGDPKDHRLRFTSIAEFAGWEENHISQSCVEHLRRRGSAMFPAIPEDAWINAEVLVGGRPWCVDDLPVVGGTRISNLWLNTGHGHTGWRLACCSAEVLAAKMAGARWPSSILEHSTLDCPGEELLHKFSLQRFSRLWRSV